MIRTLKKQLSSLPLPVLLAVLFLPILGFFCHAAVSGEHFFPLASTLLLTLGMLVFFHYRLLRGHAEIDLQKQETFEKINLAEAEVIKERFSIEALQQRIFNYSQLKGLNEKLGMSFSLADVAQVLASEVSKLFQQKDATVILYLLDPRTGDLGLSFSQKGLIEANIKAKKGDGYDQWTLKAMKPLLIEDSKSDFRFDADKVSGEEKRLIRSLMSVPLVLGNKAVGILRLDSPVERQFSTDDIRLLAVIGDLVAVTIENVQLYERVEDLAIHDSLTGLFLRRYFVERLAQEMGRALRRKKDLALLMLDLDKFKHYNDNFGHTAGDIVLKTLAMILSYMFDRPGNMVCRYGGEEFAVLLPDCSRDEAVQLAEQLRKKIEAQSIILRREKTKITASIGVAVFPKDAQVKEEFIHRADLALYTAKKNGRNRVCGVEDK